MNCEVVFMFVSCSNVSYTSRVCMNSLHRWTNMSVVGMCMRKWSVYVHEPGFGNICE